MSILGILKRCEGLGIDLRLEGERIVAKPTPPPALLAELRANRDRVRLALRAYTEADDMSDECGDDNWFRRTWTRLNMLASYLEEVGDPEAEAVGRQADMIARLSEGQQTSMVQAAMEMGATVDDA